MIKHSIILINILQKKPLIKLFKKKDILSFKYRYAIFLFDILKHMKSKLCGSHCKSLHGKIFVCCGFVF